MPPAEPLSRKGSPERASPEFVTRRLPECLFPRLEFDSRGTSKMGRVLLCHYLILQPTQKFLPPSNHPHRSCSHSSLQVSVDFPQSSRRWLRGEPSAGAVGWRWVVLLSAGLRTLGGPAGAACGAPVGQARRQRPQGLPKLRAGKSSLMLFFVAVSLTPDHHTQFISSGVFPPKVMHPHQIQGTIPPPRQLIINWGVLIRGQHYLGVQLLSRFFWGEVGIRTTRGGGGGGGLRGV